MLGPGQARAHHSLLLRRQGVWEVGKGSYELAHVSPMPVTWGGWE